MPSFQEHRAMLRLWAELPGLERLDRGVAVTFDDGPDPDATPDVLDALDSAGMKATFFLVGEQVEAHPDLAREVAERGHEIAAHCFDHEAHERLVDPVGDLRRTLDSIERVSSRSTGRRGAMTGRPSGPTVSPTSSRVICRMASSSSSTTRPATRTARVRGRRRRRSR
jgi:peptidoglycan/xylan/chitin deacetylase (PgdA/CDA1 family)